MYHTVDEAIDVVGSYGHGKKKKKKFRWGKRVLMIDQVTMQSDINDGRVRNRLVSATVGNEVYRLEFNRESEQWYLREMWVE